MTKILSSIVLLNASSFTFQTNRQYFCAFTCSDRTPWGYPCRVACGCPGDGAKLESVYTWIGVIFKENGRKDKYKVELQDYMKNEGQKF